ncbi:MAG: DUF6110 family protein [Brotaphodocola sp.]
MANCFECLKKTEGKSVGIFAAGILFGTAGIKLLSSKDARKVYTQCTAAVLRAKKCVLDTAEKIQASAEDIYAEAQEINEMRAAEETFEDDFFEDDDKETEEKLSDE